jgi:hypothetical protein
MPMTPDDLFAAVAIAVVLIGVIIAVVMIRRVGRNRFIRLAPAFDFGTCEKVGPFGTTVAGLYRGFACRYTIHPASQHNPGGASLRLAVNGAGTWSADVAGAGSRLLVNVGLLQDLEIGDLDLDQRLRFTADDESGLRSLFGTDHVRTAFREVLATENFSGVRCRTDRLEARWSPRDRRLDEDAETLRRRLETVAGLAAACGFVPRMPS